MSLHRSIDLEVLRQAIGKECEILVVPDHASAPLRLVSERNRVERPRLVDCVRLDDLWALLDCMSDADPAATTEIYRLISENAELRRLLSDVEPFIGWLAQVPDLKDRVRRALGGDDE